MTLHVNHVWFIPATALRLTGLACTLAGEGEVQRPLAPPLTVVDALGPGRRRRQRRTSCHTIPTCCRAAYSKAPRPTLTCCTDGKCWPGTCSRPRLAGLAGKDAEAHEQAAQVGKAHKSAAKRRGSRGGSHRSIIVHRGSCPRIPLSPLIGSSILSTAVASVSSRILRW